MWFGLPIHHSINFELAKAILTTVSQLHLELHIISEEKGQFLIFTYTNVIVRFTGPINALSKILFWEITASRKFWDICNFGVFLEILLENILKIN